MINWMSPLSLAPKDGTEILVYRNDGSYDIMKWDLDKRFWVDQFGGVRHMYEDRITHYSILRPPGKTSITG